MFRLGDTSGAKLPRATPIYKDLVLLQLIALVFLIDQFSKFLVREMIPLRGAFPSDGFFRITHSYNTGSAFGILQGQNTPLILVSFVGITILLLVYHSQPRPTNLLRLSLGLQMGGATGNLLDRLVLGHVTDFVEIGPWPVFNLADASIVTGLVILGWLFLGPGRAQQRPAPDRAAKGVAAVASPDGYREGSSWCPICDGDMQEVSTGWRCSWCGALETIDRPGVGPR